MCSILCIFCTHVWVFLSGQGGGGRYEERLRGSQCWYEIFDQIVYTCKPALIPAWLCNVIGLWSYRTWVEHHILSSMISLYSISLGPGVVGLHFLSTNTPSWWGRYWRSIEGDGDNFTHMSHNPSPCILTCQRYDGDDDYEYDFDDYDDR